MVAYIAPNLFSTSLVQSRAQTESHPTSSNGQDTNDRPTSHDPSPDSTIPSHDQHTHPSAQSLFSAPVHCTKDDSQQDMWLLSRNTLIMQAKSYVEVTAVGPAKVPPVVNHDAVQAKAPTRLLMHLRFSGLL